MNIIEHHIFYTSYCLVKSYIVLVEKGEILKYLSRFELNKYSEIKICDKIWYMVNRMWIRYFTD